MHQIVLPPHPTPQWWVHDDGHVIAGAIVVLEDRQTEAQILLDGALLYRSRHASADRAHHELTLLRRQFDRDSPPDNI